MKRILCDPNAMSSNSCQVEFQDAQSVQIRFEPQNTKLQKQYQVVNSYPWLLHEFNC